jgi:hypothetical protein
MAAAAAAAAPGISRESWMTELPPELGLAPKPATEGPRQFSRFGIKPRGDTSSWTDTPEQAALRAAGKLPLVAGGAPLALTAGPAARLSGSEVAAPAGVVAAVREYNEKHRQKSLLEEHLERQAAAAKEKKKAERREERERKEEERREKERARDKKGKHKDKDKERDKEKKKERGEKRPAAGEWLGVQGAGGGVQPRGGAAARRLRSHVARSCPATALPFACPALNATPAGPPEEDWVGKHPWRPVGGPGAGGRGGTGHPARAPPPCALPRRGAPRPPAPLTHPARPPAALTAV